MRRPGKGVVGVAVALALAAIAGGVLSRSQQRSGAARSSSVAAGVLTLFNQERAARGLHRLTPDPTLSRAARAHSDDELRRGYFAHNGPEGLWDVRIRRYVTRSVVAEILQFGAGRYATPTGMVSAWMHSPSHRRIILAPELRFVGFGVAIGTFRGQAETALATADFSSR